MFSLVSSLISKKRRKRKDLPRKRFYVGSGHPNIQESRVVMMCQLGRWLDPDEIVHHIDGNSLNNKPENLRVVSFLEHAKLHPFSSETIAKLRLKNCGENSSNAKLRNKDIPVIRRRIASGEQMVKIAKDYHVRARTIRDIKSGRTWSLIK